MNKRKDWTGKYILQKSSMVILMLFGIIFIERIALTEGQEIKNKKISNLQEVISEIKKSIQMKNFKLLKKYVSDKKPLYWAQCNTDVSVNLSFDEMNRALIEDSKDAEVYVKETPGAGLVETEGWRSEYPYLYFDFTKHGKTWRWLGVCFDYERSLDFRQSKAGGGRLYDAPPKLPRNGPRVFKDILALHARMEEIVHFKSFDALRPYTVKQKVIFAKKSKSMFENRELKGSEVPVDEVIEFLKKNAKGEKEIKRARGRSRNDKYLVTEGWCCEHPFITFWFNEEKDGWEWIGVTYSN